VLRRILRRAVRYGVSTLGAEPGFFAKLAPALAASPYGDAYPELRAELPKIVAALEDEETTFAKTLDRGMSYLDEALFALPKNGELAGDDAFFLYDSLGFPADLTALVARESGRTVDEAGFEAAMARQVQMSREDRAAKAAAARGVSAIALGAAETASLAEELAATVEVGVADAVPDDAVSASGLVKALFVVDDAGAMRRVDRHDFRDGPAGIVLDRTPFYAEAGGQAADVGSLDVGGASLEVRDVQSYAGYVVHTCVAETGVVETGAPATAAVDADARRKCSINHSMTHALNWALKTRLGDGVAQRGSDNQPDRLRFDFSHGAALSLDDLEETERLVNGVIASSRPVQRKLVPLDEARGIPALRAVFGEAYPDPVRVVAVNLDGTVDDVLADPESDRWDGVSIELCGGTHAVDAGAAEAFVITQEAAVAKGVRRIEAVTGGAARDALAAGDELVEAAATLDAEDAGEDPAGVARRAKALRKRVDASTCGATVKPKLRLTIEGVQKKLAALEKAEAAKAAGAAGDAVLEAAAAAADAGKTALVTTVPPGVDGKAMAKLCTKVQKAHPALALLAVAPGGGKVGAFASVPDGHGVESAPAWLNAALAPLGGRGGGKPTFAQGSAKGDDVDAVIAAAEAFAAA